MRLLSIQVTLLCMLLVVPINAQARWKPDRLPTIKEMTKTIKYTLTRYDSGRCRIRKYRRKHPRRCIREDGKWRQARLGVWRWYKEDFREEFYNDQVLQWYAKGILNALQVVGLDNNFNYYVSMVMEALRQSKFYPRAWSRYNRDSEGNFIRFDKPWCDGRGSLLSRLGKACGPEDNRRPCKNAIDLFQNGVDEAKEIFRKRCDWADRKGGDGGAYQMHMSTLARVSRMPGFRPAVHDILGHKEPWHYTMGQHFWVSALAGAYWQKAQASDNGCGRWMKKRYSRKQLRWMAKKHPRSATYSCFKTRYCNGTPMRVGNARSACRLAKFVRHAFKQVMEDGTEITLAW